MKKTKREKKWDFNRLTSIIKENRLSLIIVVSIFIFAVAAGLIFPNLFEDYLNKLVSGLFNQVPNDNYLKMASFIIFNNIKAAFIAIIFGTVFVIPIFITLSNGYVIGAILSKAIGEKGISTVLYLIPHGIFELPAFLIALALGLGTFISLFDKKKKLIDSYKEALFVFLVLIIPFLIIAGFIESALIWFY